MLSLIVAMDKNQLIGSDNRLPWHLSDDLKHFKVITMGKPIIMGRKTYESIGKALPGRRSIVITRNADFQANGCEVTGSLEQAISLTRKVDEAVIIGGVQIYQQALQKIKRMYITQIDYEFQGDAWFPEFNMSDWQIIETEDHLYQSEHISFAYHFITAERN